jgi:hypothetical protein
MTARPGFVLASVLALKNLAATYRVSYENELDSFIEVAFKGQPSLQIWGQADLCAEEKSEEKTK